ncbi:uncharacterized protein LOC128546478 [Mercenaria mercenaria]|uniref:uncharacterized protein LOC128546478 n=1 Tax=Mercenaria mercenaria TaxID=6596 RepID=UPI00234F9D33|nr:uncharacterized protein LOC128546478 [Mercenaria mercenaria]
MANNHNSTGGDSSTFLESVNFTDKNVADIELCTRQQRDSDMWMEQRKGRLTASKHHAVKSKMNIIGKSAGAHPVKVTPLVAEIFGHGRDISFVPSVRHGQNSESKAMEELVTLLLPAHSNLTFRKSGLYVKKDLPYIAASPDGILTCNCCGQTVIEIKCPYKIFGKVSVQDGYQQLDYLQSDGTSITLKESHPHYFQVQSQMAVTGIHRSMFVVWSGVGCPLLVPIKFCESHWRSLLPSLVNFFKAYILPHLFGEEEFTFCPVCSDICLPCGEITISSDNSICCNTCQLWFHWKCVNLTHSQVPEEWFCDSCSGEQLNN